MAIQIRNGTNTEWESNNSNIVAGEPAIATDAERFFVGTASGNYAEFANLDIIAPAYDTSTSYVVGDVINRQGKLYSCNTPCSGAFNVSYWDEKSLAEILKDLADEIDYAQYEIGYASGELITIDNGASEIPVKDLTLDIDAVQDLHGYDYPWVGGAGKNLLKVTNFSVGQTKSVNGVDFTYNSDGSFTINGTSSTNNNFVNLNYTANTITIPYGVSANIGFYASTANSNVNLQWSTPTGQPVSLPCSSTGFNISADTTVTLGSNNSSWLRIQIPTSGTTVNNLKIYPFWCLSSNKLTQYEPYTNICPISGWDEVDVTRTGKNLVNKDTLVQGSISYGNDTTVPTRLRSEVFAVKPSTTYSAKVTSEKTLYVYEADYYSHLPTNSDSWVGYRTINSASGTFTPPSDAYFVKILVRVSDNSTIYPSDVNDLYLNEGSSIVEEPYNGATYTTDLDGTRYGGTLDATTGVLTIDKKMYPIETNITYTHPSDWKVGAWYCTPTNNSDMKSISGFGTLADAISNIALVDTPANIASMSKQNIAFGIGNERNIFFYLGAEYDTQEKIKQVLSDSNAYYVAELATPQVVQLTPTQVSTVLGTNNLWNQMNSNNELAYRISNALN